jgi:hypothetical protein
MVGVDDEGRLKVDHQEPAVVVHLSCLHLVNTSHADNYHYEIVEQRDDYIKLKRIQITNYLNYNRNESNIRIYLPEDNQEFKLATKGSDWWHVCWEMDQWLRSQYKYMPDEEYNEDKYNTYVEAREKLNELMHDSGVSLDDVE